MAKMERQQDVGEYLGATFVKANKITSLKLVGEPRSVTTDFDGKEKQRYEWDVEYAGKTASGPQKWRLPAHSINALIDKYGEDSDKWIEQDLPIKVDGSGAYEHVAIDELRLK